MDHAQLLQSLLTEEEELQLPAFDLATVQRLGSALQERALREKMPVAIEIARGGHVAYFALMPGASPDNGFWVRRKRAVVERFHRSSLYMHTLCESQGRKLHERYGLAPEDFASSGGAFPIKVRGTGCVGVAAVSGLAAVDDHRIITEELRRMLAEG